MCPFLLAIANKIHAEEKRNSIRTVCNPKGQKDIFFAKNLKVTELKKRKKGIF
jgi:hypothetical protein